MNFVEKISIKASPEQVFGFYEDVAHWSSWDSDIVSLSINGEFKAGATGLLKPVKGPESKITFTEVTRNRSFTTTSKLLLCTMSFEHQLIALDEETEVVHKVSFIGVLSPLFRRLIGPSVAKGLPESLCSLKEKVEAKI